MTNALDTIRRAPAIFAVLGLAVFMLAACGGRDGGDEASAPAETPRTPSPGGSRMTITPADGPAVTVKPDYRKDGEAGDATRGVVSVNVEDAAAGWRSEPLGSYFNSPDNAQLSFAVGSRTGSIATATIRDSRLAVGGLASSGSVEVTATGAADPAKPASLTFRFTVAVAPQEEPVGGSSGRSNSAPAIADPGDKQYAQRETIAAFDIAVSDPDSDALTVSVSGLPDGLTYSSTTGQVSGTVAADAAAQAYTATVTADDGVNEAESAEFTITVAANGPPTIVSPEDRAYDRDEEITAFGIAASDPENDPLTVTVTGLPDGLTWSSGQVSGTVAAAAGARDYTVTVAASDGLGEAVTGDFTIRVWKLVEQTLAVAADNARRVQGPYSSELGKPPVNNVGQARTVARREYNDHPPAVFDPNPPNSKTTAEIAAHWTSLAVPLATAYCAARQPPGPNVPDNDPAYAYRANTAATVSSAEDWAYSSNQNTYPGTLQFYARKTRTWTATCERTVRRLDE